MSTRCQIAFYEKSDAPIAAYDVLLYKHSDGYPSGVIPAIKPFLERFAAERGIEDAEYCAAWLLYELMSRTVEGNKARRKMYADLGNSLADTYPEDGKTFLGFGVCGDRKIHGDTAYFYRVTPEAIKIYVVTANHRTGDPLPPEKWKLVETVPYDGKPWTPKEGRE